MSDIFLSYSRADRARAEELYTALKDEGFSVWFDLYSLRVGNWFAQIIEREVAKSKCVIVLWSKTSVRSRWVRGEALVGLNRERLLPATIEPGVQLPLLFQEVHTSDLSRWTGSRTDPEYLRLVEDVRHVLERPDPAADTGDSPPDDTPAGEAGRSTGPVRHSRSVAIRRAAVVTVALSAVLATSSRFTGFPVDLRPERPDPSTVTVSEPALAAVQRARSAIGRKTRYQLGMGGMNPEGPLDPGTDTSGFIAWVLQVPREVRSGRWMDTDAYWRDGALTLVPAGNAAPGDLYVYPDAGGRQGHMGIISQVRNGTPTAVIHCSMRNYRDTGDCVRETDPGVFTRHPQARIVRPDHATLRLFGAGPRQPGEEPAQ